MGVLMIQPLFPGLQAKATPSACSKNKPVKPSCSKSKCSKPKPADDKKDCENSRCNPLLGCPSGNFYAHHYSSISIITFIVAKEKNVLVNDNRVFKQLTECWHPPEIG